MKQKYQLIRVNEKWGRYEVYSDGSICQSDKFNSLAHAAKFVRSFRNFGRCMNETMRYW